MRALVVHSGNMYGGLERALEALTHAAHGVPRFDLSFAMCFDGPIARSLRGMGHEPAIIGEVRLTRPTQVLRARRMLAAVLAGTRPDVVVTTAPWTHAIAAPTVRRAGLPLVLWLHDALSGRPYLERLAGRHQPDLLVANSACCLDAARSVFPGVSARVVYSPLVLTPSRGQRANTRRANGVVPETIVIITVARMESGKGQSVLLDALSTMDDDRRWVCWLVGGAQRPEEARYVDALARKVAALGLADRIRFLGHRGDVADLLDAADVCCHPHLSVETFGLAIVEALHAGLPVVTSDRGGPREILSGGLGSLVPPGDAAALARALSHAMNDATQSSTIADARRARAADLCDPTRRATDFSQALESVRTTVAHA